MKHTAIRYSISHYSGCKAVRGCCNDIHLNLVHEKIKSCLENIKMLHQDEKASLHDGNTIRLLEGNLAERYSLMWLSLLFSIVHGYSMYVRFLRESFECVLACCLFSCSLNCSVDMQLTQFVGEPILYVALDPFEGQTQHCNLDNCNDVSLVHESFRDVCRGYKQDVYQSPLQLLLTVNL
jgi:hypothetical protein